jgi:hypothetical protein
MKEKVAPWHELVFICPDCGKEFQPKSMSLCVRLCAQCITKNRIEDAMHWKGLETAA